MSILYFIFVDFLVDFWWLNGAVLAFDVGVILWWNISLHLSWSLFWIKNEWKNTERENGGKRTKWLHWVLICSNKSWWVTVRVQDNGGSTMCQLCGKVHLFKIIRAFYWYFPLIYSSLYVIFMNLPSIVFGFFIKQFGPVLSQSHTHKKLSISSKKALPQFPYQTIIAILFIFYYNNANRLLSFSLSWDKDHWSIMGKGHYFSFIYPTVVINVVQNNSLSANTLITKFSDFKWPIQFEVNAPIRFHNNKSEVFQDGVKHIGVFNVDAYQFLYMHQHNIVTCIACCRHDVKLFG